MAMNLVAEYTDSATHLAAEIHALVNRHRTAHGLRPLALDPDLSRCAQAKAGDIAASWRSRYNPKEPHHSPLLGRPPEQQYRAGLRGDGSENWAMGPNLQHIQAQFEFHHRARENQLRAEAKAVGIGVVRRRGDYVVVQHFA